MKKERATKQIRIRPSTHEILRKLAFKRRASLADTIRQLVNEQK
jgi:hypothetical protein